MKKFRKSISIILCIVLTLSLMPVAFAATTPPTAEITMEEVGPREGDGKTIYKLVATAKADTGIKIIETWFAYDNTKVVPVATNTYGEFTLPAEGEANPLPFKRDILKDSFVESYTFATKWYYRGNKTIVMATLDVINVPVPSFDGTYLEFYFRLADNVTLDDFNNTTFAIENQDTTPSLAKAWTIQTGNDNTYIYYNKNLSGTPANDWEPTLTYENSTVAQGYQPGTVTLYETLDFTKLANTPVKNGEPFKPNSGVYWELIGDEYTLTLYNVNIDVTAGAIPITIPSGITVQFMGANNIIGGAGHTGQGIRASYKGGGASGNVTTELDDYDIMFIGIGDDAAVRFNTTSTAIDVYTDLNGTTMTVENLKISAQRLAIGYVNNYLDLSVYPFIARTGHLYINDCDITSDSLLGGKIVDANCVATVTDSKFYVDNSANSGKGECYAIYADDGLTLNNTNVTVISNNENPTTGVRTNGKLVVNGGTYTFTNIYGYGFDGYTGINFNGTVNATNITYGGVFNVEPTLTGAATLNMTQKGLFTPEKTVNNGTYTGTAGGWSNLNTYYEAPVTAGVATYNGNIPQNGETGFRMRMNNGYTGSELDQMNAEAVQYGLHWNPITSVLTLNNVKINNTTEKFAVNTGWNGSQVFKFLGDNIITTNVNLESSAYGFMANAESEGNEEYTITSADPADPAKLTVNVTNGGTGSAVAFQGGENVRMTNIILDITSDNYGVYRKDSSYAASYLLIENSNVTIDAPTAAISINTNVDEDYYWPELTITKSNIKILSGDIELVHQYRTDLYKFSASASSTFDIADGVRLPNDGSGLAAGSYKYKNGWVDAATIVEKPVATVDGVQYNYIGDAIAAISKSGTVTMIDDAYEDVVIPAGKTITLNLGDYTIENGGDYTVLVYGTLSVNSGANGKIIENSGVGERVAILCYGGTIKEISGGTFEGSYAGLYVKGYSTVEKISGGVFRGSENGGSVGLDATESVIKSISGGEFTGDYAGIGLFWATIESISGGTFKGGNNGIWLYDGSSGVGTISGGTFIGTVYHAIQATDDGYGGGFVTSITGGTFNAAQCGVYLVGGQSVTLTGGKFKVPYQSWAVYGGTAILPTGYILSATANAQGYYEVLNGLLFSAVPDKTSATLNDIITVPVIVEGIDYASASADLIYDKDKLELISVESTLENHTIVKKEDEGKIELGVVGDAKTSGTPLATAKFKVIALGVAEFKLENMEGGEQAAGEYDGTILPELVGSVKITRPLTVDDFIVNTDNVVYNGAQQKLAVNPANGLVEGTDYTLSYDAGWTNAGTYSVTVNAKAGGNYTGSLTYYLTIDPAQLTKDMAAGVTDYQEFDYTGTEIEPQITVTHTSLGPLTAETDYDIEYTNNKTLTEEAKITITGKGNYAGTFDIYFQIVSECDYGEIKIIQNYAASHEDKIVLLLLADTQPAGSDTYLYDTEPMYYVADYNDNSKYAYVFFIDGDTEIFDANLLLTVGAGTSTAITHDGNVNLTGSVNINDAQAIYDFIHGEYKARTDISDRMRLEADVNGSQTVDGSDLAKLIGQIFNITDEE